MTIKIDIDYREKGLIECLRNFNDISACIEIISLDVGDVRITHDDEVIAIIERKTSHDLISSIKDGRYHEQKRRLLDNYNHNKVYYLVEINECFRPQTTEIIRGAIVNTMVRDNIKVIMVQSLQNSALFIKDIVSRVIKNPQKYIDNKYTSTKPNHVHTKKTYITKDVFLMDILSHIPGISTNIARVIAEYYDMDLPKMIDTFDETIISELKLPSGRRVGSKIAEQVKSFLFNGKQNINIEKNTITAMEL
jgi:ERCC4-type nuclease